MPVAKPTLGYPSRTAAVVALRERGLTAPEIAARIGIDTGTVYALEASAVRKHGPAGRPITGRAGQAPVWLPQDLVAAFANEARRRELTGPALITQCLGAILADDLLDAVLDP